MPGSVSTRADSRGKPSRPLPREHGAWALLLGPLVVGLLAARHPGLPGWVLGLSATALFLAREPAVRLLRGRRHGVRPEVRRVWIRWAVVCSALGLAGMALLVLVLQRPGLALLGLVVLPLLAVHLWLTEQREERSIPAELLGIAALTLAAPAAWYTATGSFLPDGGLLWILCVLYFSSAVFYVKMQVSRFLRPQGFLGARRLHVAYHGLAAVALALLVVAAGLNPWIVIAYLPMFARSAVGAVRGPARLNLKQLGYLEVAYTTWFVFVLGWLWGG